jgi:BlaI family transcriptional regulator, penicillinase repressor
VPRNKSTVLTESELRLMDVLWEKGEGTVAEIAAALPVRPALAYNTVLTIMRILEIKGYVRHRKPPQGRAFVYRPRVGRDEATRGAVRDLLRRFFGQSHEALVLNILQDEKLDEHERQKIRDLLNRSDKETQL